MATQAGRDDLMVRMNRIIGQCEGIRRMIQEERACPQIIQQLVAVRAALAQAGVRVLKTEAHRCFSGPDPQASLGTFEEMVDSIFRLT